MAKKKKDKNNGAQAEAADSIRAAIERGLQLSAEGAQATQKRTRELVDEIASAAGRVRQSLEDMRVLDELRKLRNEIEALGARVTALERPRSSAPATPSAPASAAKPAASRSSRSRATKKTTAARKSSSSSRKTAAKKPAARKSTAKKTTSTRSRAKKPSAAKPSSSGSSTSS